MCTSSMATTGGLGIRGDGLPIPMTSDSSTIIDLTHRSPCCRGFQGHCVDVGSVADRGGAVMLLETGRGGEELQTQGLQRVGQPPPARKRGEGKVLESDRSLSHLQIQWCLLRNHFQRNRELPKARGRLQSNVGRGFTDRRKHPIERLKIKFERLKIKKKTMWLAC
jgi:hypothetical protein